MDKYYRYQFRRDTAEDWAAANPILRSGEPGVEKDTNRFKLGDGQTAWNNLPYFVPSQNDTVLQELQAHIISLNPHPAYDDLPSFKLLFENGLV